ncbi:response regulator [Gordonia sp. (in: high G+C Gram-positive bacteria)]|uniref:response regulator n=1 Tax=Gordonia sp. (in: high G+C Gram-positive bacteria) TaxID=84139 RepID=UPI003F955458
MNSDDSPLTVIIVDDHRMVRRGVCAFLSTQDDIRVVGEADDGGTGADLAARHRPDVALVDLVMDGISGIETLRRIKEFSPKTKTLVLTSFDDDSWVFAALRAGADSYVLKDVGSDELAVAVRRTAHGETVLHPRIAARVVRRLRGADQNGSAIDSLTDRELEVVGHIAQGENNRQIAAGLHLSDKTVKAHVGRVLDKLGLADRTQIAVFAWRNGIARR